MQPEPAKSNDLTGMTLGRRVRGLRGFKMWSQQDLAREAGVHVNTVSSLERGADPTLDTLRRVARALGTDVAALIAGTVESDEPALQPAA